MTQHIIGDYTNVKIGSLAHERNANYFFKVRNGRVYMGVEEWK